MAVSTVGSTNLFLNKSYSYKYSIGGNQSMTISGDDLGFETPDGYSFMCFLSITTGSADVVLRNVTNTGIAVRNVSSTASNNVTLNVTIRYIKLTVN